MTKRGPNTENGKRASSRNAVKHDMGSRAPVNFLEDPADWYRHLEGMRDSLQPEGYHENVLVERIAVIIWRTRRPIQYELARVDDLHNTAKYDTQVAEAYRRGILSDSLEADVLPEVDEADVNAAKARRVLPSRDDLMLIMRY